MIRMVGSNSGDFVCTQVLHNLWKLFLCKKCSQTRGSSGKSASEEPDEGKTDKEASPKPVNNLNYDVHTSEFDEDDEDQAEKSKRSQFKESNIESLADGRMKANKKPKTTQPQLKLQGNRKKSSLIGRLFSDVSAKTGSSSAPKSSITPAKSRSIHLMYQQKQQRKQLKSSQYQPQARDERFSIEMKRFQSIKRVAHPANRRARQPLESTAELVED